METYLGGIRIENANGGVNWICNKCPAKVSYEQQSIRNHLAVVRRRTKTGKYRAPTEKKEQRMGNLRMHVLGYIGKKCKQTPVGKMGEEIWADIVNENRREDDEEP